nr:hypothetical protein [Tanacetum cinerariifolium]
MCEMFCQIVQKKREEKRIEEEQAAKAQNWKLPICCDDDDDYNSAITPNEPDDSLSMGDEHLNTILATKSDEFIKSCVENLVPNPTDYESDSSDYQSCFDEDFLEEIFSNPLFEEEVIPMKIDQHQFNVESDLIESMLNHDSSIIPSSSKIDSVLDDIEEDDYDSKRDILILEELPSNYSLSLPEIESFYFDIPSFFRPPAKPPDGNT